MVVPKLWITVLIAVCIVAAYLCNLKNAKPTDPLLPKFAQNQSIRPRMLLGAVDSNAVIMFI